MSAVAKRGHVMPSLWSDFFDTDRFFADDFFKPVLRSETSVPPANVVENENEYRVELGVPGMKKEDFKIDLDENTKILTISAESKEEKTNENKKERFTRREYSYHSFSRSFSLPENADLEAISGKYENGMMILTIAKRSSIKPSKKEIKIG
jgi:HSP20 family protein